MSSHVFHEIFIHLNWHAKVSRPALTPEVEPIVHSLLQEKMRKVGGANLHGKGGTETHVHLAISIEPHISISEVVRELKGYSAHELNQQKRTKYLEWQRGFGAVSFGRKQLPWVLEYLAKQKEHHGSGNVVARLEATGSHAEE